MAIQLSDHLEKISDAVTALYTRARGIEIAQRLAPEFVELANAINAAKADAAELSATLGALSENAAAPAAQPAKK